MILRTDEAQNHFASPLRIPKLKRHQLLFHFFDHKEGKIRFLLATGRLRPSAILPVEKIAGAYKAAAGVFTLKKIETLLTKRVGILIAPVSFKKAVSSYPSGFLPDKKGGIDTV
jgi:hypothetical protein